GRHVRRGVAGLRVLVEPAVHPHAVLVVVDPDRPAVRSALATRRGANAADLHAPVVELGLDLLVRNEALPGALAEDQIGRIVLAVLTNGIAESRQVCERIAGRSVERPRGGHRRHVRALRLEVQLITLVAALVGYGI